MKIPLILMAGFLLFCAGCGIDTIAPPNYNAELLGPLVNGRYSGADFIKDNDQFSQVGPDGLVTLMYRGEIPPLRLDRVVPIPDQQFAISGFPSGQQASTSLSFRAAFMLPNGIQLTEAEIRSGIFRINLVNTNPNSAIDCSVRLKHALRNGTDPVVVSGRVQPMGTRSDSTNLAGVKIDMTRSGEIGIYNGVELEFTLTALTGTVDFGQALSGSTIVFRSFKPALVRGYLGTYQDTIAGTFAVPIFDKFFSGELLFENPYITSTFANSFGLSAQFLNSNDLYISGSNAQRDPNDSVVIGSSLRGVNVTGALSPGGMPAITTATISGTNDNFPAFLSVFPSKVRYQIPLRVNTTTPVYNQFIADTSRFAGAFEFGLPLSFKTQNLSIRDTLPFKMSSDSSLAKIVDGKLITFVNNGLPVEFYFQAYFLDDNGVVGDSLFESQQLVQPATISGNGRISSPSQQKFVTNLDVLKADKVKKMRQITPVFRVRSIPEGSFVKIYNDFKLDFKVVGDLRFNLLSETN
jgi:hypothetical protein